VRESTTFVRSLYQDLLAYSGDSSTIWYQLRGWETTHLLLKDKRQGEGGTLTSVNLILLQIVFEIKCFLLKSRDWTRQ